jgi:hypothetical protein
MWRRLTRPGSTADHVRESNVERLRAQLLANGEPPEVIERAVETLRRTPIQRHQQVFDEFTSAGRTRRLIEMTLAMEDSDLKRRVVRGFEESGEIPAGTLKDLGQDTPDDP